MSFSNVLVIPCYNEASRLEPPLVLSIGSSRLTVLLVNDGSSDGTAALLERLVADGGGHIHVLHMEKNSGKAEAVRAGFNWALGRRASRIGFADADFATSPRDILRLLDAVEHQEIGAVLGCRVPRMGARIQRRFSRHITSRVFAMLASASLRVTVYDTQCGAKWFRSNEALRAAVAIPFESKWAFDVELLGRLLGRWGDGPRLEEDDVLEVPIRAWRDVGGSKVSLKGMMRALRDMLKMAIRARRLGPAYTATLRTVPIEYPIPHASTSWAPSFAAPRLPEELKALVGSLNGGPLASVDGATSLRHSTLPPAASAVAFAEARTRP